MATSGLVEMRLCQQVVSGRTLAKLTSQTQPTRHAHERGSPSAEQAERGAIYDLMFNQSPPAEAIAKYAGATYRQHTRTLGTANRLSSTTSTAWQPSTRANAWNSSGHCPRATTWSCTATRSGAAITNMLASIFSASTRTARSSSTGTYYRSSPKHLLTRTGCSRQGRLATLDSNADSNAMGQRAARPARRSTN